MLHSRLTSQIPRRFFSCLHTTWTRVALARQAEEAAEREAARRAAWDEAAEARLEHLVARLGKRRVGAPVYKRATIYSAPLDGAPIYNTPSDIKRAPEELPAAPSSGRTAPPRRARGAPRRSRGPRARSPRSRRRCRGPPRCRSRPRRAGPGTCPGQGCAQRDIQSALQILYIRHRYV